MSDRYTLQKRRLVRLMGNHGGTLFKIKLDGDKITIDSKALYTQKQDYKSVRYVRPVEDF